MPLFATSVLVSSVLVSSVLEAQGQPVVGQQSGEVAVIRVHQQGCLVLPLVDGQGPQVEQSEIGIADSVARFAAIFVTPRLRPGEEIVPLGRKAVVGLLRPAQHEWVQRFLARQTQRYTMAIDCRFVDLTPAAFKRWIEPLLPRLRPGSGPAQHVVLQPGVRTRAWLAALDRRQDARVLAAPILTALPAQRVDVSIKRSVPYVKDFRVEVGNANAEPVPVLANVEPGLNVECRAARISAGRVGVTFQVRWSELREPMLRMPVKIAGSVKNFEIEVPHVESSQVKADLQLAEGAVALFVMPAIEGRKLVFCVSSKSTDLPD